MSLSTGAIAIRPYRPADWSCLCRIHDAARLDELRLSVGEEAFLSLEQTAESEGLFASRLDVAEYEGDVAGFIAFSDSELTWLYVDPPLQRLGVGRALVQHALGEAGSRLTLEVLEGNEPALQLYLSLGFRIVERKAGRLTGNEDFEVTGLVLVADRATVR